MPLELPHHVDPDRLLGRRASFDDRSRRYSINHLYGRRLAEPVAIHTKVWPVPWLLDQTVPLELPAGGQWDPSACTGFSRINALNADPIGHQFGAEAAFNLYRSAQQEDEFPDTPPAEGSSVIAAAKVAHRVGYVHSYWWGLSLDEIVRSLIEVGPGVAGSLWTEAMFEPDSRGFISPWGAVHGGHAYCLGGVITELNAAVIYQSWGPWSNITDPEVITFLAEAGVPRSLQPYVALIDLDDLWSLLSDQGEYCISIDADQAAVLDPSPDVSAPRGCSPLEPVHRATAAIRRRLDRRAEDGTGQPPRRSPW